MLERMDQWRQGMGVRRFHTIPGLGEQQTVGHHSCGVALIVLMCHPSPSVELLKLCLFHDLNEGSLGDLPATTKWRSSTLLHEWDKLEWEENVRLNVHCPSLDHSDHACFLLADGLEGLLYCRDQMRVGNQHYRLIADRWAEYLYDKDCWDLVPIGFRKLFAELWNTLNPERPLEAINAPGLP